MANYKAVLCLGELLYKLLNGSKSLYPKKDMEPIISWVPSFNLKDIWSLLFNYCVLNLDFISILVVHVLLS